MTSKTLIYFGVLLIALVAAAILLNRGVARGVVLNTDIGLSTDATSYIVGGTTRFTGTIDFADGEEVFIQQVALVAAGPGTQDLDVALPLEQGTFNLTSSAGASGTSLTATVSFANLIEPGGTLPGGSTLPAGTLPGGTLPQSTCAGTLPSGTLPGDTLPGTLPGGTLGQGFLTGGMLPGSVVTGSGQFRGSGSDGRITYTIDWKPTTAGFYQGQIAVILVDSNGCAVSRSPVVSFSFSSPPPPPPPATATSTETPTPSPTATATATATPSPTATATATATPSPTATATATAAPLPTATPGVRPPQATPSPPRATPSPPRATPTPPRATPTPVTGRPGDNDGNGIADAVDTGARGSDSFSDGTTGGVVSDRGDQILTVTDAADAGDGILIAAAASSRGLKPAAIAVCGGAAIISLDAGDIVIVTCGSVTIKVIEGMVEVTFVGDSGTEATTSLGEGNELTFDPETLAFEAPAANPDAIVVQVEDEQISVAPGEHAQADAQISLAVPTATPPAVAPQPTFTPVPEFAPSDDGLGAGAISAITIAIVTVLTVIGGITYSFVSRSKE